MHKHKESIITFINGRIKTNFTILSGLNDFDSSPWVGPIKPINDEDKKILISWGWHK